ncbi:MAG: pyridoxal-phosphate dependent enzyme, partial [Chloroflexota bacterium]
MTNQLVTIDQMKAAWSTIQDKVHRTPMSQSTFFSNTTHCNIYLKEELFQKTGSFKVRGVSNKMNSLTAEEKSKGVITISAGNHAQAVAWSAGQYGIPATV